MVKDIQPTVQQADPIHEREEKPFPEHLLGGRAPWVLEYAHEYIPVCVFAAVAFQTKILMDFMKRIDSKKPWISQL